MSEKINQFIRQVLSRIQYKKIRQNISLEIQDHIEESKNTLMEAGMPEEEACSKAVQQMGDPCSVGDALNRVHRPRCALSLFFLIGILAAAGIVIQFFHDRTFSDTLNYVKQIVYFLLGAGCLFSLYFFNYRLLYRLSLPGFLAVNALFAILFHFCGDSTYGRSFLHVSGVTFQPSLLLLLFNLVFYAGIVKRFCTGNAKGFAVVICLPLLPFFLMLQIPSTAGALLMAAGFYAILAVWITCPEYKGGRRKTLYFLIGGVFLLCAAALLFFLTEPYRLERLTVFLHPEQDMEGGGWVNYQIRMLLQQSNWIGDSGKLTAPIGTGGTAVPMIPGLSTDFVLDFVIGRFGWLAGAAVMAILLITIVQLTRTCLKIRESYGRVLSFSICAIFSLQVLINLMISLNLLPIIGISLPFLSFGGSSYLVNMAMLGLLLGIYRRKDVTMLETAEPEG